jgi:hypothetical protein
MPIILAPMGNHFDRRVDAPAFVSRRIVGNDNYSYETTPFKADAAPGDVETWMRAHCQNPYGILIPHVTMELFRKITLLRLTYNVNIRPLYNVDGNLVMSVPYLDKIECRPNVVALFVLTFYGRYFPEYVEQCRILADVNMNGDRLITPCVLYAAIETLDQSDSQCIDKTDMPQYWHEPCTAHNKMKIYSINLIGLSPNRNAVRVTQKLYELGYALQIIPAGSMTRWFVTRPFNPNGLYLYKMHVDQAAAWQTARENEVIQSDLKQIDAILATPATEEGTVAISTS